MQKVRSHFKRKNKQQQQKIKKIIKTKNGEVEITETINVFILIRRNLRLMFHYFVKLVLKIGLFKEEKIKHNHECTATSIPSLRSHR